MNQQIREFSGKISEYWKSVSSKNKLLSIGLFIFIVLVLSLTIYFVSKPNLVPLYTNEMSQQEIGDIKAELDRQGFTQYQLGNNGTTILVPEKDASNLLVSLAAKGLPKTGSISFSEMAKNMQFGATDRQLDAMEREALQGQVANLLSHVNGVKSAQVVISTPKETLFIKPNEKEKASASVVITLQPGYELEPKQVQTLYHLVSKSIPNLPKDNIIMTDQYGNGLDNLSQENAGTTGTYEDQRKIQKDVETDIQKNLQQMLGTIIGQNKVFVQAYVRLNFDQVKTKEDLVEPVNKETNEGIAISAEKIQKTYSGKDSSGAVSGTGESDTPGYAGTGTNGAQENKSDDIESRVNYEVNRISKEIVQSPYKIEDMTINVGVEPPDPKNPGSLTKDTKDNIQQILSNVVRTALSDNPNVTDQNLGSRITVFPREFSGNKVPASESVTASTLPKWLLYSLIGAGALLILLILFLIFRRKKPEELEDEVFPMFEPQMIRTAVDKEEEKVALKQQIEQMAKEHPGEFVGLLRNWMKE
ncbi:flagellar basal-body MS-ring/collar protein FliF [Neobacillus novalis]|uniref:Flagellar M-ring protein n=1 Tax=Neobacillus novalis TaxID=220687 RepID=A0AA95MTT7_9BACI|nr:flagellar basal-body MS-ring/collar protein FliF [Neobacillus novalis]WHY88404.1 flagellar basal-body MS-ring/collar protein FliF [Neobacillus novalis]